MEVAVAVVGGSWRSMGGRGLFVSFRVVSRWCRCSAGSGGSVVAVGEGVREERRVDEVNRWVSYRGRRLLSLEMMDRWNSSSSSFVRAALMLYILYIHTPVQSRPTPVQSGLRSM